MATLRYASETDIQLHLDPQDEAILTVVRGCPWWTKGETIVDHQGTPSGVTLTTTRPMESTLRRILDLSFGLVFPPEGGVGVARAGHTGPHAGRKRNR